MRFLEVHYFKKVKTYQIYKSNISLFCVFTASFQKLAEIDTGGGSAEYLRITWTEGINRKPPVLTMSYKSIIHYKKKEKDSGRDLGKPPNHSDAFTNCTNFKDLLSQFKAPTRS